VAKSMSVFVFAILVACNGASLLASNPPVISRLAEAGPQRSWMTSQKRSQALLYISSPYASTVTVYEYPQLKEVGELAPLDNPDGMCTDADANLWVTLNGAASLTEFSHGGTKAIATLADPGYYPVQCSVNLTTGALAVANWAATGSHFAAGSISIYAGARGSPKDYESPASMYFVEGCTFDSQGNLYVAGRTYSGSFVFGELPKGSSQFIAVPVSGAHVNSPGAVRWAGKYVVLIDQSYRSSPQESALYQIKVTPSGGQIVGKTVLQNSGGVYGFTIDRDVAVAPDGLSTVQFYNYPAGGDPISGKTLNGLGGPTGSAVSK